MTDLKITSIQNNNFAAKSVTVPNFCGTKTNPVPQDTVEMSGKKKKNNFAVKLLLGGLGIGAITLALIKFHKTTPAKAAEELSAELKEVQKIYKDIFKRDINAEETKDFVKRYKSIIDSKTPDNDREYCEKLLDEICKDRQTKRPKIRNWNKSREDTSAEYVNSYMVTSPEGVSLDINIYNYQNNPDIPNLERALFQDLFHETHHVKQTEMEYRADKEGFLEYIIDKIVCNGEGPMYKELLEENGGDIKMTNDIIKQIASIHIEKHWGSFEPFAKDSAEYYEGLRLLEGDKNYKQPHNRSYEEYYTQIIEIGANEDEKKANRLFDILKLLKC